MVDVVAIEQELERALATQDKAEAELVAYVENATALDAALFERGRAARQKRVDDARANVQAASARTTRLPIGGSLIDLWDRSAPPERREILAGFLDRIDVRRGASGKLAGHLRIFWSDGSEAQITHDKKRVRVAAA